MEIDNGTIVKRRDRQPLSADFAIICALFSYFTGLYILVCICNTLKILQD